MTRLACAAAVVALAAALVPGASATELTIVPGVGIGKIKLGMTQAQVERVLGKDHIVNERATVGGAAYQQLSWNLASWTVAFIRTGRTWHAIQITTTVRQQRTTSGVGVLSPFPEVAKKQPNVFCGGIYSFYGQGYQNNGDSALMLVTKGPVYTAFAMKPVTPQAYSGPWKVYSIIVQKAVPGHMSLVRSYECAENWRELGRPR